MVLSPFLAAALVSISAPEGTSEQLLLAVEQCRHVLPEGGCDAHSAEVASNDAEPNDAEPNDAEPNDATQFRVTLRWDETAPNVALVEFVQTNAEGPPKVTLRRVEFGPADPIAQRYRALGLVVAAHVLATGTPVDGNESRPETGPSEPQTPIKPQTPTPARSPAGRAPGKKGPSPSDPRPYFLDASLLVGGGFSETGLPLGAGLRAGRSLGPLPLFAVLDTRWSYSGEYLDAHFVQGGVGVGARVRLHPWFIWESSVQIALEAIFLRASRAGEVDATATTRIGPRLSTDFLALVGPHVGLGLGADAGFLRPDLAVNVGGIPTLGARGPELQARAFFRVQF